MDCMNYSYSPYMLDEDSMEHYENEDIVINIDKQRHYSSYIFWVSAYSYDGSLDFSEQYDSEEDARKVYNYILDKYSTTPPDGSIENEIESMLYA